jgi:lysine N6-hydroxylase
MPENIRRKLYDKVYHTASYLFNKEEILNESSVTLVGSGQSAAEIFQDLLPYTRKGLHLSWITRSDRFFPLENHSRLTLELTSPEYIDYFYSLPEQQRINMLKKQSNLYKGINYDLINQIYNSMYAIEVADGKVNANLMTNSELLDISFADGRYTLNFLQLEQQERYELNTACVVMATGYKYHEPAFLKGIASRISKRNDGLLNVSRNYAVDHSQKEIFVQNAELHTHGLSAPDLGMGAYRNAIILNEILGREVYKVEQRIAFQYFDAKAIATQGKILEAIH